MRLFLTHKLSPLVIALVAVAVMLITGHAHAHELGIGFAGMAARNLPSPDVVAKARLNLPNAEEGLWQPYYDTQTYAAAGQAQLSFFSTPYSQRTNGLQDTNMVAANAFPGGKSFYLESIELEFIPGVLPGRNQLNSAAAGGKPLYTNDVLTFAKNGVLQLSVGSKTFLTESPLGKFPPHNRLIGYAALSDSTTAAGAQSTQIEYAQVVGPLYQTVGMWIPSTQEFAINLLYPSGAVALPSTVAGSVRCTLNGFLYRTVQ